MPDPSTSVSLLAPAKVNLTLRITGRRDDGYHLLETLMVPVSLFDDVHINLKESGADQARIECVVDGPAKVQGGADNLAARAAAAVLGLAAEAHREVSVRIELLKRIPAGAGLGGGSSDAAAVLAVLPGMLGINVSTKKIHEIAVGLGADVPFCLASRPSVGRGIGDELEPIEGFPETHMVVAVAPVHVETAWAYANAVKSLTSSSPDRTDIGLLARRDPLSRLVSNDFEQGVIEAFPQIGQVRRQLLSQGAVGVVMSGSGSAMVGLFETPGDAGTAAQAMAADCRAFAVRTLAGRPDFASG